MITPRALAFIALFASVIRAVPTPFWKNGSTFFNIGQNYADEWQGFVAGTGVTPAGISVYGDIWSGTLNPDSVNLLSTYAASHR